MRHLLHITVVAALALPHAVVAEGWISLGGMGFELDAESVGSRADGTFAWVRNVVQEPRGRLTVHMLVVANCAQGSIEIERGILESDWSSRLVEMPELPPQDRFMTMPVENPAFNNLYGCR